MQANLKDEFMNKIEIGMLTKPQGLKGEFRVKHKPSALQLFFDLNEYYFKNTGTKIIKV